MECDENVEMADRKQQMELPQSYYELLKNARKEPTPFTVVRVQQLIVKEWTTFF